MTVPSDDPARGCAREIWALYVESLDSCLLLSCSPHGEPAVHLLFVVHRRVMPERALNRLGWRSRGHWQTTPWGLIAPVAPALGDDR